MLDERAQERVLDEIVGAVDLARERDRKGAQARDRRQKRIPEVRLRGHFSTPVCPLLEFGQKIVEAVGHRLLHEVVVHGAQMVADAVLDSR